MQNKITAKYLYDLVEDISRKVYLLPNGVISVRSSKASNNFKKTYDAFISEKHDNLVFSRIRKIYYRAVFSKYVMGSSRFTMMISDLLLPAPYIKSYGSILDIGCSTGGFLVNIPDDWNKFGIEINTQACKIASTKGIQVWCSSLEEFTTKKRFDIIRGSHVIEHISDTEVFIKKIKSLLRKGGFLILYTPNSKSLSARIFGKYFDGYYDATHFNIFNNSNIGEMFRKQGFEVIESSTYYMGYSSSSLLRFLRLHNYWFSKYLYAIMYLLLFPISLIRYLIPRANLGGGMYLTVRKM